MHVTMLVIDVMAARRVSASGWYDSYDMCVSACRMDVSGVMVMVMCGVCGSAARSHAATRPSVDVTPCCMYNRAGSVPNTAAYPRVSPTASDRMSDVTYRVMMGSAWCGCGL